MYMACGAKGGNGVKYGEKLAALAWYGAVAALVWAGVRYALVWLLPFLLALGLAMVLEPLMEQARRRLRLKRGFTAAVVTLVLVGGLLTVLIVVLVQAVEQALALLSSLPEMLAGLPEALERVQARVSDFCAACPEGLRRWAEGALAVFFTLTAYPQVMAFLRRQLPARWRGRAGGVKASVLDTLGKWLRAECILLLVTFLQLLAGLLLLRQEYALLLALLIALIDALPVFGTGTVLLPWAAVLCVAGDVPRGIALAALYAVIAVVRSVLEPKVMAAQVGLPPLVALAAMYVGFRVMGVAGMVLLPLAVLVVKQLHDGGFVGLWR